MKRRLLELRDQLGPAGLAWLVAGGALYTASKAALERFTAGAAPSRPLGP